MPEASATPEHHWAPERIVLRRVTPTFGFTDVRVKATPAGLRASEPVTTDKDDRPWPTFRLPPRWREALAREIAVLWGRTA